MKKIAAFSPSSRVNKSLEDLLDLSMTIVHKHAPDNLKITSGNTPPYTNEKFESDWEALSVTQSDFGKVSVRTRVSAKLDFRKQRVDWQVYCKDDKDKVTYGPMNRSFMLDVPMTIQAHWALKHLKVASSELEDELEILRDRESELEDELEIPRDREMGSRIRYWTAAPTRYDYDYTTTVKTVVAKDGKEYRLVESTDRYRFTEFQIPRYQSGFFATFEAGGDHAAYLGL